MKSNKRSFECLSGVLPKRLRSWAVLKSLVLAAGAVNAYSVPNIPDKRASKARRDIFWVRNVTS